MPRSSSSPRAMLGLAFIALAAICDLGSARELKAPSQDVFHQDGLDAKAFCSRPAFNQLKCSFAGQEEERSTLSRQCLLCGTAFTPVPPALPALMKETGSYHKWAVKALSLACQGQVVVRSVFKIQEESKISNPQWKNCTSFRLDSLGPEDGPTVRCELELPKDGGDETQRALRAKEGNCYICTRCSAGGGCPSQANRWYSDTYITTSKGCGFGDKYQAQRAMLLINPRTSALLAKLEACNSPGCFNGAYEQAKLKGAKKCVNGICPA